MNEVRLIDANALKQDLRQYFTDGVLDGVSARLAFNQILHDIDNAPTVEERSYEQGVIDGRDTEFDNGFEQGYAKGYENCEHDNERPQGEWITVSERLPNDLEPVNITWINHEPEPYYKEIKDKPFTATGVYFNGQWYWWSTLCTDTLAEYSHNYDDIIDKAIEIIAWRPLPEPYKEGGAE